MKLLNILLTAGLLVPTLSHALEAEDNYPMFCGDRTALVDALKKSGEDVSKITDADFKEANESRKPLFTVLTEGMAGVQELVAQGNKSGTGSLGAVITCGMIVQIKDQIASKGCTDLEVNKPIFDNGGIAACEKVIKSIQGQSKN